MMKKTVLSGVLLVSLAALGSTPASAEGTRFSYSIPFEEMQRGFALALTDRHLNVSCKREALASGPVIIANGAECLKAAQDLKAIFKGQYMEFEVNQHIKAFLSLYSLNASI